MDKKQNGFISVGLGMVIFAVIIGGGILGIRSIFKDEINSKPETDSENTKVEEPEGIVIDFPKRPTEEKSELPKEVTTIPDDEGEPIIQPPKPVVTAAGEWHGRYDVTAPEQCKGESGGWQAILTEAGGVIRGNFETDSGLSGSVGGNATGADVSWGVGGGGAGINFKGAISGNTMSGTFLGLICEKSKSETNPNGTRSSGTYFGGRIVPL